MDNKLQRVMALTEVLKYPDHRIYTFGNTQFNYKVVSSRRNGSVLRNGKLICKSPMIVTPETLREMFNGFSGEAVEFARYKYEEILSRVKVLGYQFRHNLESQSEFSENARTVAERISSEIKETGNETAILICPDDIWSIAIIKIMFDVIKKSAAGNFNDMAERGFFLSDQERKRNEIEILFAEAIADKQYIDELANRLQEYSLFDEYEDRFFQLFK